MIRIIFSSLFSLLILSAFSQSISINNTGNPPNSKSMLDISSNDKGVLIPRMTTSQRLNMNLTSNEAGMLVFDISINSFCIFNGTQWEFIESNDGNNPGTGLDDDDWRNSITDNNPDLNQAGIYHIGNVGIGHQFANYLLDIEGDTSTLLNVNLRSGSNNSGSARAAYFQVEGNDNRNQTGSFSIIGGNGNGLMNGHYTQILNNGSGVHSGFNSYLIGTGTGRKFGFKSYIGGNGANERFGTQNHLDGIPTGNAKHYGVQNLLNANGGGTKYGVDNILYGQQNETLYGLHTYMTTTGNGTSIGVSNSLNNENATNNSQMIGVQNFINGVGQGNRRGVSNSIEVVDLISHFGVYNNLFGSGDGGLVYGNYTNISASGLNDHYGIYSNVVGPDDGKHYAGYFNAPGNANDYAAVFNAGNVIANESGGNYDFRIESENNASIFFVNGDSDQIGIGTFDPERRLHIQSEDDGSSISMVENTSSNADADGLEIKIFSATSDNQFVVFRNGTIPNPIGSISGNASGGISYNITSDARLKQKIQPYQRALHTLKNIGAYEYEMKSAPGVSQVGFLAQELYTAYPFAVSGTPENTLDNPMMVDYSKMTPLLLSAIKEQQIFIEDQQSEIEHLNDKVEKLQKQMDEIERLLRLRVNGKSQ